MSLQLIHDNMMDRMDEGNMVINDKCITKLSLEINQTTGNVVHNITHRILPTSHLRKI